MSGNFPNDFLEFVESCNKNKVNYILVGPLSEAYSLGSLSSEPICSNIPHNNYLLSRRK